MRLGIDLDGVTANFVQGWITRYNAESGTDLTEDMVVHWDGALDLTHFESMDEFWDWAGANGQRPTVFRHLTTYPQARDTMVELAQNHDIVILTMKPDWAGSDTFAWIADHHIPTREVHLLREKWRVACDIYLDDSPYVLPSLVRNRPQSLVCRFVRPWNTAVEGTYDIHTWDEFADLVNREAAIRIQTA